MLVRPCWRYKCLSQASLAGSWCRLTVSPRSLAVSPCSLAGSVAPHASVPNRPVPGVQAKSLPVVSLLPRNLLPHHTKG